MRLTSFLILAAASAVHSSALAGRQTKNAGYLAAVFTGSLEQVYFELAPASSPQTFKTINGGKPVLIATEGTGGARDPSILQTQDGSKLYILATDLQIGKTTWGEAQRVGSRSIHIWESSDGVTWSSDHLVNLMPSTAGFVWAPSAIHDPSTGSYAVFWSSGVYAESDPQHTGTREGPYIYYAHTSDFKSFTDPQRWTTGGVYIDQEIQHLSGNSYIRYLKDTSINKVYVERSDSGLFGTWTRLGLASTEVREGPASFQDIQNPARYYVWLDNYSGKGGYECHYTEDFKPPFPTCETSLSPTGMRHGGVIQVDQQLYDALAKL
ncbi:Glycoside hydrolase family 43 [Teratosphaeria destructans]|uniref:Glycoside hydrolase family 43 n=1 Tax=Teratosphaeria destructans TaxID=418781 RepID=A0A9W7SK84_9PEZI|nr:Glycoside hydrolase family 43 [Teratosphaeria destructans]